MIIACNNDFHGKELIIILKSIECHLLAICIISNLLQQLIAKCRLETVVFILSQLDNLKWPRYKFFFELLGEWNPV